MKFDTIKYKSLIMNFEAHSFRENTDGDAFVRVDEASSSKDESNASHVVDTFDNAQKVAFLLS